MSSEICVDIQQQLSTTERKAVKGDEQTKHIQYYKYIFRRLL